MNHQDEVGNDINLKNWLINLLLTYINKYMETKMSKKPICQSCGMPMNDTSDLGTNADGGLNFEYCHFCYRQGHFKDEGISLEEKMMKNIDMAVKKGLSLKKASNLATAILPKLKRWR